MLIPDAMTPQVRHTRYLNRQKRMVGMLTLSDLALRGPPRAGQAALASRGARLHATQH